jgi:hypothetical protein
VLNIAADKADQQFLRMLHSEACKNPAKLDEEKTGEKLRK